MPDTNVRTVMKGLEIAVKKKQLSPGKAGFVTMIVKDEKSASEVAAL